MQNRTSAFVHRVERDDCPFMAELGPPTGRDLSFDLEQAGTARWHLAAVFRRDVGV
jgi:hypothetical protein